MNDNPRVPALPDDGGAEEFADALRTQRRRVREFLAALGERQRRAQAELESWIARCEPSDARGTLAGESAPDPNERAAVRALKVRNEELVRQLQKRPATVANADRPSGSVLDWEAEKRRMLAALEAECDDGGEPAKKTRLEVEEVLRRTDLLVADKSREIAELQLLLEDQSANLGSVAVGAAAVGGILDRDAIVQEERGNLLRAQAEGHEKLRKAEIEIAIERAQLARERAEIDEKLRVHRDAQGKAAAAANSAPKADKSSSGRWLARLGLKDPKSE
jgi:hypothetical protein